MDTLKTASPGPRSESREALPLRYGCCGSVYAAGLYHWARLGFATLGSPTISARMALKSAFRRGALAPLGLNGKPEERVWTPLKRHPPAMVSAMALWRKSK